MKTRILNQINSNSIGSFLFVPLFTLFSFISAAQGTWTVVTTAPHTSGGNMLVLSDGRIMCKSESGGTNGNVWDLLKPDSKGDYSKGTWTSTSAMKDDRLYFSSQMLMDGRIYVAGGEYGSGKSTAEVYDALTNIWTSCPAVGATVSDANSAILEDGKVLQALVAGTLKGTKIWDPKTNTYAAGPSCLGIHNESTWVKLPDNSILQVDRNANSSERYIPSQNKWVADATVPVSLYDPYGLESSGAVLLPDGRSIWFGSLGFAAVYTPSGTASPGTWAKIPDMPGGAPDGVVAMMVDGKILLNTSDAPTSSQHFPSPTTLYEYDYKTQIYTAVPAPAGGSTINSPCYTMSMVDLPDGRVMFSQQGSSKYYVYQPTGAPLVAGKPKIDKLLVTQNGPNCTYKLTGTQFNGISEGACYGDDVQMASNYPIIRLTSEANQNVYYARTFNWNSTGVLRGTKPDTTNFTLPAGLPAGTYSLVVTANGIASDPISFSTCGLTEINEADNSNNNISVYPIPAAETSTLRLFSDNGGYYTFTMHDLLGKTVKEETYYAVPGDNSYVVNFDQTIKGLYMITLQKGDEVMNTKIMVK